MTLFKDMASLKNDLDEMCSKFLDLISEENQGCWDPIYEKSDAQIYKSKYSKTCFKIQGDLNNSPESCFDLLADAVQRPVFDDMCETGKIVQVIDDSTMIVYSKMKGIWPTAPRDVLLLCHVRQLQDGSYLCVNKSIEHPDMPDLEKTLGIVRINCSLAGNLCKPAGSDKSKCKVIQIADGDLRGFIPKWLITFIATQGLPKSFRKLDSIVSDLAVSFESKFFSRSADSGISQIGEPSKMDARIPLLERRVDTLTIIVYFLITAIISKEILTFYI